MSKMTETAFLSSCHKAFVLLLFCYLIFTATPTHSSSFLACRTFFSWVTLWKTSQAVSLPHFSHLISCLCSIAWKWSTCYSQGGHRHRRGLPDLVYLEDPTAKGSKVSIQTGFIHYERHWSRWGLLKCTLCGNMSIMCVCVQEGSSGPTSSVSDASAESFMRSWLKPALSREKLWRPVRGGGCCFTYFFTWRPDRTLRTNKTLKES